jgi:hypothetical protein
MRAVRPHADDDVHRDQRFEEDVKQQPSIAETPIISPDRIRKAPCTGAGGL